MNEFNIFKLNAQATKQLQRDFQAEDFFMLKLIAWQWLIVSMVDIFLYNSYFFASISGGILFISALIAHNYLKGTLAFRNIVALILLSFAVIMIQQSQGRIEMHFYIFVLLSFLILYKDIVPMTVGAAFIAIHHFIFNYLQEYNIALFDTPIVVFNYGCGLDIVILHAAFVIFEWLILSKIIILMQKDKLELLRSRNALNSVNQNLESMVKIRTNELEEAKKEAIEANKMKSEFLANMSHEIRTPMNAIIGFTELLNKLQLDHVAKNYVVSIKDSSKLLLSLINDILDLAKVEAGKLNIQKVPTDIDTVVKELNNVFRHKAKARNISFETEIQADIPHALMIDDVRVTQILFNLISNALKFTHEGGIKIAVTALRHESNATLDLIFSIEDSGIGIIKAD